MPVSVFQAKRIITLNGYRPFATHVAVRDGRILGMGDETMLTAFGPARLDDRFAAKVLMPGFVEGHAHVFEGMVWDDRYVGFFDRRGPDGRVWPGLTSIDAVVEVLAAEAAAMADPTKALSAWGFDPIYFDGRRMTRCDLDRVSTTRPVLVLHASAHILNVNSAALDLVGLRDDTDLDGLVRDEAGRLTGELLGPEAMGWVRSKIDSVPLLRTADERVLRRFADIARASGVTTCTDLLNQLGADAVEVLTTVTGADDFPIRLAPALAQRMHSLEDGVARWKVLAGASTDRLKFGLVKLVVDGSIQGFTARLRWPGYHNGAPNGMWYMAPADVMQVVDAYHAAGAHLQIHTNGDQASELAIDAIEAALIRTPRADHRHTLQHAQMLDEALLRRMKTLGICCNIFANHIYYWGDAHAAQTMGPVRAERLDPCGTALRLGVPFSMHSDAPITPVAPLFTAWCAVNRLTASGALLGAEERIPVEAALRAITLGAAYTMKLDHLIGSIDVGKYADFAVLDDDPLAVDPMALKDVGVHATVVGGRVFPAPGS